MANEPEEEATGGKLCPECEAKIGAKEETCPACGINIEEFEESISAVERVNKVIEKRKGQGTSAPSVTPAKKKSILSGLANLTKGKRK